MTSHDDKHEQGATPRTDAIRRLPATQQVVASLELNEQLERELAAANRSLDWCGKQIDGCGKYTKESETIAQALERNWTDSQSAFGLFAKERIRAEKAERELAEANRSVGNLKDEILRMDSAPRPSLAATEIEAAQTFACDAAKKWGLHQLVVPVEMVRPFVEATPPSHTEPLSMDGLHCSMCGKWENEPCPRVPCDALKCGLGAKINGDASLGRRSSGPSGASDKAQEQASPSATLPRDETAWLVENAKNEYLYYDGFFQWTPDVNKALRFARRADAEMVAAEGEDAWYVREHMWCAPPAPQFGECPKCGSDRHQPMPECAQEGCPLIVSSDEGNKT